MHKNLLRISALLALASCAVAPGDDEPDPTDASAPDDVAQTNAPDAAHLPDAPGCGITSATRTDEHVCVTLAGVIGPAHLVVLAQEHANTVPVAREDFDGLYVTAFVPDSTWGYAMRAVVTSLDGSVTCTATVRVVP